MGSWVVLIKMGKKSRSELQKLPSPKPACSELSLAAPGNGLCAEPFSSSLLFPAGREGECVP